MDSPKSLLKLGQFVRFRNGKLYLVTDDNFISPLEYMPRNVYTEDLLLKKYKGPHSKKFDVIEIYNIVHAEATLKTLKKDYPKYVCQMYSGYYPWFNMIVSMIENKNKKIHLIYSRPKEPNIF